MSYQHRPSRLAGSRAGIPPSAGHSGRARRALGVQAALEWAFRVEKAQLDLPEHPDPERGSGFGFGIEYVLLQRAALGCRIDGGQYKFGSYTHADAEVIAATLAGLPDALGGKRMAIRVAELARAGMTPDWMPGAVPRCVPVEVKRNQHGERATAIVVGTERVLTRGKWRRVEVLACPVTFSPHPQKIEAARRAYDDWWRALGWVREGLIKGGTRGRGYGGDAEGAAVGALTFLVRNNRADRITYRSQLQSSVEAAVHTDRIRLPNKPIRLPREHRSPHL